MNLTLINQYLGTIALLVGIANAAWIWLSRPAADLSKRISEVEADIDERIDAVRDGQKEHDRRIQRVEDDMRHLPTKDDLHEVKEEIAKLKTELHSIGRTATRIDEYLRSRP